MAQNTSDGLVSPYSFTPPMYPCPMNPVSSQMHPVSSPMYPVQMNPVSSQMHPVDSPMYHVSCCIGNASRPYLQLGCAGNRLVVLSQTINRNRRPTCYVSICATAAAVASSDSEIPLPISSLS